MIQKIKHIIKNYRPPKFVIALLLVMPLIFAYIENLRIDSDIWFLLNHGRYVLQNGFPTIEPFSIHAGFSFVMQQWLSAVIYWLVYKYFGEVGLRIILMILFSIIIYIIYKLCMLISNKKFYLSSILTMIISILLAAFYIVNRPQVFSYIIFLLEFYVLELYIKKKKNKYLFILPILSVLLINIHASMWFMLFLFILPYLIDSFKFDFGFIKGEGYSKKPLIIATILMIFAGLINPYGIHSIAYIFGSFGVEEINAIIGEMKSLNINSLFGKIAILQIFSVIFIYAFYKKGKIKLRYLLLYCGTVYLSLANNKSFALFIVSSIFPLANYLKDSFNVYVDKFKLYSKRIRVTYKVVCFVTVTLSIVLVITSIPINIKNKNYIESKESVEYIIKNYDINNLKVYTGFNDGSYAQFNGIKTYIDARAEVYLKANNKKEDIFIEYYKLQHTNIDCNEFLNKYKFDLLIIDKTDKLNLCLDNYMKVHTDKYRSVYEKK